MKFFKYVHLFLLVLIGWASLFADQSPYRGNCKTEFGVKPSLFPLDSIFCKVPMAKRICHFAKNRTNEKIIEFDSRSQFCNSPYLKKIEWQNAVQTPEDRDRLAFFESLCKNRTKPLNEIPQVLHVVWLGPKIFPAQSLSCLRSWMSCHPGWQLKFWTDQRYCPPFSSMQVCPLENFPLQEYANLYYSAQSIDERSLILKYAILLDQGGICIDPNAECLSSLEPLRVKNDFFSGLEPGIIYPQLLDQPLLSTACCNSKSSHFFKHKTMVG